PVPLDLATYGQILSHEKIHADQKHSLDILLAEILLIFQWYNPFAWMYRKSVRQNIEYLTDDVMVKNGADMTDYQMSLLRVSVPEYGYTMVANYNQSLLKKRILMMNAKKSSFLAGWKYILLVAVLSLSLPLFNAKALDVVPDTFPEPSIQAGPILIDQNNSDKENGEDIVSDKSETREVIEDSIEEPVSPQFMVLEGEIDGTWEAILKDGELCLRIIRSLSEDKWNWINHHCHDLSEFTPSDVTRSNTFRMTRDAGTLIFKGKFNGNKGEGDFEFVEDASFNRKLANRGVKEISPELMFRLFFVKDQEPYIDNLVALSKLNIPGSTLREILPEGIPASLVQGYLDEGVSVTKNLNFLHSRVKADLLKEYM
ncbi:MAG: hypothetical protein KDD63_18985, partial [Bacteroidetes bacterium]|nr:hypothetical protein [Bacteroidota bacterium]